MSKRAWLVWTAVLVAVSVAAVAYWNSRNADAPEDHYRFVAAERGAIAQIVSASGTLQPTAQVNIGTQVSGTIARVHTDFNRPVKAGQVLAEIDPALFNSALKQAQANLQSAQAQLQLARANEERTRSLVERTFVSAQQLDSARQSREAAEAQVAVALAQLERARTDLDNTIIRAPVDGVVVDRKIDVGQTVAATFQTPSLFVIARDLGELEIHASVSEADIGAVREGLPVEFRVDAHFDRRFAGRVRQIRLNPKSEQGVVTYNVVIGADNPERLLLPGMTARVDIVVARVDDALKVANAALRFRPTPEDVGKDTGDRTAHTVKAEEDRAGGARVYRLRDGKPEAVPVKTGISDGRSTALLGGAVQPGDRLIVRDLRGRQAGEVSFGF
jgi:HlyD family secretion protein